MTDNATNIPRIVTNADEYGSVEQIDIDRFREIYARWPEKYRKLIEANGVTFVLGTNRAIGLMSIDYQGRKSWEPGKVYIDANELDEERFKAQAKEAGISYRTYTNLIQKTMFRSLLAALGDGASNVNWQPAFQEANKIQLQHQQADFKYSDKINYIRPELILNDGRGNSEKAIGRPEAQKVYEQYIVFVDGEYEKLERQHYKQIWTDRMEKSRASETAFAINNEPGILTEAQQRYFWQLNEVVKLLGITPKEFDERFRYELIDQIAASATYGMRLPEEEKGTKYSPDAVERWEAFKEEKKPLRPSISGKRESRGHIKQNYKASGMAAGLSPTLSSVYTKVRQNIDTFVKDLSDDVIRHIAQVSCPGYGIHPPVDTNTLNDEEHHTVANFLPEYYSPSAEKSAPNLIQAYCAGATQLASLRASSATGELQGFTIEMPGADKFFTKSIGRTVTILADKQLAAGRITQELHDVINDKLEKLKVGWDLAIKTPEEYEQYIIKEDHQKQQEKLRQEKKAQQDAARQAEEKAQRERQAAQPEAFIISSAIYAGIEKYARKASSIHRSTPEAERMLYENMAALSRLLSPFLLSQNLNAKIQQHKAFGDVLFNDDLLRKLEYVFHPANSNGTPNVDAAIQEQARTAIQAIYAVNDKTPDMTPERLATNERLKRLIEQSHALVIAAIGSNEQLEQLRKWQQTILSNSSNHEIDRQIAHRKMRDAAYGLLNTASANVQTPPPELAVLTTDGRILVTDRAHLPDEKYIIFTLAPDALTKDALDAEIEKMEKGAFYKESRKLGGSALENYNRINERLLVCSVNDNGERDTLFRRIREAFATGNSIALKLEEAMMMPLPQPHEDREPDISSASGSVPYEPWFRPINQSVALAAHFVHQELAQKPDPYRLFCSHTTRMPNGRYALILKMYRYAEEEDGRIVIAMPPHVRSLVTGDTEEHALNTLQAVQHHVLRIPGITRYVRLDQSRVDSTGDDPIIPNRTIINGNGMGEVFGHNGKLYLRLRYNPPVVMPGMNPLAPQTILLDLQYAQEGQNYAPARDRANEAIAEIQYHHQQGRIVTRNEMNNWIVQQYGPAQPTVHDHTLRLPAHFPQDDQTVVIGGPLVRKLYPQDMWTFQLRFEYGDPPGPIRTYNDRPEGHRRRTRPRNEIRDVTLSVPLHSSTLEHALELRKRVVEAVIKMLNNERDRAQWDWLDEGTRTLNVRHRVPAEGPPHEFMDATRLLDICNIAAAFEGNHRPVIYQHEQDDKGNLIVTYRLQRTYQGQGIDDWFHEQDPHNPEGAPVILERKVIFPPTASEDVARDLEWEAQRLMERSFVKFNSFTEAYGERPQIMKTQQQYKPATFINDFEDALAQPLELDTAGEYQGGTPGWPRPPRNRGSNGHNGGGNGMPHPPNGHHRHESPNFDDDSFIERFGKRDTGDKLRRI